MKMKMQCTHDRSADLIDSIRTIRMTTRPLEEQ